MSNAVINIRDARATELTPLAKDLARRELLKEQEAAIKDELSLINARLATHGYGKHEVDGYTFTVQKNRRIDNARVEAAYPVLTFPQFYKPAVDLEALKQNLAPVELDAFYNEGAPVIR